MFGFQVSDFQCWLWGSDFKFKNVASFVGRRLQVEMLGVRFQVLDFVFEF